MVEEKIMEQEILKKLNALAADVAELKAALLRPQKTNVVKSLDVQRVAMDFKRKHGRKGG